MQGLKRATYGLWMGLYRQVAAPVVVFHVLASTLGLGLWGVWWGWRQSDFRPHQNCAALAAPEP
ncbi:MAG: hypothetical protein ACKV19_08575 [Verrucomicrobiales bacterium]